MDIPNNLPNELSYIRLGPGPQREILESLLTTLPFDYVIQPVPGGTETRLRVLLIDRLIGGTTFLAGAPSDPLLARKVAGPARAAFLLSHEGHPSDAITAASDNSLEIEQSSEVNEKGAGVAGQTSSHNMLVVAQETSGTAPETREIPGTAPSTGDHAGAAPASTATEAIDPAARELKNKIKAMQQMFEERKQLGTSAPVALPQ